MHKNSQTCKMLELFLNGFAIGDLFYRGDIHRNASQSIHDLSSCSTAWFIRNFLINTKKIVYVGKGKNGAYLYKRVY